MKWKRSRKAKEQVETAQEHKSTNENLAAEPQVAGLGKQDEEVDDGDDFLTDTQHADFLQQHADARYASDDDVEESRGGDRMMGAGL